MNPEEIQKEFSALKDMIKSFEMRLEKFEKVEPPLRKEMSEQIAAFGAELKTAKEEFGKKIEAQTADVVAKIAAEFSKVVGTTIVKAQATDTTKQEDKQEPDAGAKFLAKVQAEFAKNGGSKTKAMAAAIAADMSETGGKGHQAFVASGKSVNYSKA